MLNYCKISSGSNTEFSQELFVNHEAPSRVTQLRGQGQSFKVVKVMMMSFGRT